MTPTDAPGKPSLKRGDQRRIAKKLGVAPESLPEPSVLRRSIDARRGSVHFHLIVGLG